MKEFTFQFQGANVTVICDDGDLTLISQHHWSMSRGYPITRIDGKTVYMHRLILGVTDPALTTHHINKNKLDNRKANLALMLHKDHRSYHKGKSEPWAHAFVVPVCEPECASTYVYRLCGSRFHNEDILNNKWPFPFLPSRKRPSQFYICNMSWYRFPCIGIKLAPRVPICPCPWIASPR